MHPRHPSRQGDIHPRIHQNLPNSLDRKPHYSNQFPCRQIFIPNLHPIRFPREIKCSIRNAASNHSGYWLLAAGYFFFVI